MPKCKVRPRAFGKCSSFGNASVFHPKALVLTEFKNDKLPKVNKFFGFVPTIIQQVYISVIGIGILTMFGTKDIGPYIMRNF
jgi:hypothetical protein